MLTLPDLFYNLEFRNLAFNKPAIAFKRNKNIQDLVGGHLIKDGKVATKKLEKRDFIKNTKSKLNFNDTQLNWELLKYEIRKFIISYSKVIAKEERARRLKLENTLKFLENNLTDNLKKQQYGLLKCELDEIYEKIAEGVRVRSRCQQYEEGEKSNKFFSKFRKSARFPGESP